MPSCSGGAERFCRGPHAPGFCVRRLWVRPSTPGRAPASVCWTAAAVGRRRRLDHGLDGGGGWTAAAVGVGRPRLVRRRWVAVALLPVPCIARA